MGRTKDEFIKMLLATDVSSIAFCSDSRDEIYRFVFNENMHTSYPLSIVIILVSESFGTLFNRACDIQRD